MELGTSNIGLLEEVILMLHDEKVQLENRLETEIVNAERQKIEERIAEIDADIETHKAVLPESAAQDGQVVRRSERVKKPTEK